MKRKIRTYSGTQNMNVSVRELNNRQIARKAATEGIVLLKNENHLLPFKKGQKVALFGGGAVCTVKGGTGSGDVNERETVNILQGMENADFEITTKTWLEDYAETYRQARADWKNMILEEARGKNPTQFFQIYASHPFSMPAGRAIEESDLKGGADTAIFVISRIAGEGADRKAIAGDYYLSEEELNNLEIVCGHFSHVALILNTGSQMDLSVLEKYKKIESIIFMVQAGMEGGNALADILSGAVVPSGKLTDTWAVNYKDYPASAEFSLNDGNVEKEYYKEGIYVGYRYFDSFGIRPRYAFGFGLSYTSFDICPIAECITADEERQQITVRLQVKNTGKEYSAREVVQIYVSCPQNGLPKELKRLCGFAKTANLNPGEMQEIEIAFPVKALASFDETAHGWIAQNGRYGIWAGNSSDNLVLCGSIEIKETTVIEITEPVCPLQETLTEINRPTRNVLEFEKSWHQECEEKKLPNILLKVRAEVLPEYPQIEAERKATELVEKLTEDELVSMVIGEINKGQSAGAALGSAGIMVPGAAGETSSVLEEKYDIPGLSMADGPAGLRLMQRYHVSRKDGSIITNGLFDALEGGFFSEHKEPDDADVYYQYCTAIPVGTLLAQSWDTELIQQTGKAVGEEMQEMGVTWWLAPGMNIHRDPLCGRNFEYYSEDPVLSGTIAAAMTKGVQAGNGTGTTIKHFACNNQEENRMGTDSIVSERALREIYLKGFEIAVKLSQPMAVMTSYNLINGVHSANNYDLCTQILRKEWGFKGIVMTDWTTTDPKGGSISWKCIAAGNDLIMPGREHDIQNIYDALKDGSLSVENLKDCVTRLVSIVYQSNCYEEAIS